MTQTTKGWRGRRSAGVLAFGLALALLGAVPASTQVPPLPERVGADIQFQPISTVYTEDFQGGDGGFTVGGAASWEFGEPVDVPVPGVGQSPQMWGTNLAGDYGPNECGYVQSPAIDLGELPAPGVGLSEANVELSTARVLFRHWMHTESRWDGGLVLGSSDGVTWKKLPILQGPTNNPTGSWTRDCLGVEPTDRILTTPSDPQPAPGAWSNAAVDASEFLGGTLHLRFVFSADSTVQRRGWYIGDIAVQTGVGGSAFVAVPSGPEESEVPFVPVETLYATDFNVDDGGFAGGAPWEWGEPVTPPDPVPGSLNMWGTRLTTNYEPSECGFLTSPEFELPGVDGGSGIELARFSYRMWKHIEAGYDAVVVQVSVDDGPWTYVQPKGTRYDQSLNVSSFTEPVKACLGVGSELLYSGPSAAPGVDAWTDAWVDLTPFMGRTVRVRFGFSSDSSVQHRGFYLDDVQVRLGVGATVQGPEGSVCLPLPGWRVTATGNTSWCYGPVPSGPASSGKPVYGTNLAGNYGPSECGAIESPDIDLALVQGLGALTVAWEHLVRTNGTDDGGIVQVSSDGGETWSTVTPVGDYPATLGTNARACVAPGASTQRGYAGNATPNGYTGASVRLTGFSAPTLRVRFVFGSGPSLEDIGWYVRSMTVHRGGAPVVLMP